MKMRRSRREEFTCFEYESGLVDLNYMTTEKVVIGNEGMKQSKLLYSYLSYIYSNKKNEVKDKYT